MQRKKVKPQHEKLHKPQNNSPQDSWSRILWKWVVRFVVIMIVLVVSFFLINLYYPDNIATSTITKLTASVSPDITTHHNRPNITGIPSYDEYVVLAKQMKWNPTDPVKKLEDTIKRFPQIFDLDNSDQKNDNIDKYIQMLQEEVDFLLKVLQKSQNHQFDLSHLLFIALDAVNQCTYRVMKHRVWMKSPSIVTKGLAEQWTRHWIYHPLKQLVTMKAKNSFSHITLDATQTLGWGGLDALSKAVQYRIYGLFTTFAWMGSNQLLTAFHLAIINGDDLAVALLLKLCESHPTLAQQLTIDGLVDLMETTKRLSFPHIQTRLLQAGKHIIGTLPDEVAKVAAEAKLQPWLLLDETMKKTQEVELYNEYLSTIQAKQEQEQEETEHETISLSEDTTSPICQIDAISLNKLTVKQFYEEYIMLNKPLLITLPKDKENILLQDWSEEAMLKIAHNSKTWMSHIPYGKLFGEVEQSLSLQSFLQYLKSFESDLKQPSTANETNHPFWITPNVMNLTAYYETRCSINSPHNAQQQQSNDDGKISEENKETYEHYHHCIPLYLFSNDQQEIAQRLKPLMINYLKQTIKQDTLNSFTLWDLIFAVSTPNITLLSKNTALIQSLSSATLPSQRGKFQFFYGPTFSGAPWHSHGPAFNILLRGQKRWNMFPPGRDIYTRIHPVEWIGKDVVHSSAEYPFNHTTSTNDLPCHFYQAAGEVLYVPRHWSHQVLNMEETLGFAVEVDQYVY